MFDYAARVRGKLRPEYPPARFRVAVVQIEPIHEDVLPAVVHLLRLNGAEPIVYLNQQVRALRPGFRKRFPELSPYLRFVPLNSKADWRRLARRIDRTSPDLVLMTTFQFNAPSSWVSFWDGPMLGIVHNPEQLMAAESSMELVASGRIGLLTLARHVTAGLMESDPIRYAKVATITMAFPRPPQVPARDPRGRARIAVPGRVDFGARNYEQIVTSLPRVLTEVDPDSFEVWVVGGGPDRAELEQLVGARGAGRHIRFAPQNQHGHVPGNAFYGLLSGSAFLLASQPVHDPTYRATKLTAMIPTAIGLGVPPILDRWSATVYGVPAVSYPGEDLADGLVRALTMSAKQRTSLQADLHAHRVLELHRSSVEMAFALQAVGLTGLTEA